MTGACFLEVSPDPAKLILSLVSFSLAVLIIVVLRKFRLSTKARVALIYSHLSSLFFPFALFSTNLACGFMCLPCFESPLSLALLSLPTTLLLSALAGFVVIPAYYMRSGRAALLANSALSRFVRKQARKLRMRPPSIYILDMVRPVAFSFRTFRSAIVLSVGLLDILSRKEQEAVALHELSHLRSATSLFKLSASLMRFSPFSFLKNFSREVGEEERKADVFVVASQGTGRHLKEAKRKMEEFEAAGH